MSCTFHYKFPLVSLGQLYVHGHAHACVRSLGKKERRNLSWDGGERTRQKRTLSYSPLDINSSRSYVVGRKCVAKTSAKEAAGSGLVAVYSRDASAERGEVRNRIFRERIIFVSPACSRGTRRWFAMTGDDGL